jgi:hypothetical protein
MRRDVQCEVKNMENTAKPMRGIEREANAAHPKEKVALRGSVTAVLSCSRWERIASEGL